MIKERQIEHLFSLHRFRFVQAHLSKGAKRRTKAAQRRQFLDVLMVACGLRNACLPDHGVTLDTEAWQEVLESLRREGHALVTGLDVIELEGTPLIVHRERLCSAFEAEAWRKLFSLLAALTLSSVTGTRQVSDDDLRRCQPTPGNSRGTLTAVLSVVT